MAAAIREDGPLLPSLGVATVGAVLAVLVFSVALLAASAANALLEAMLMRIAVLVLLNATHYSQRFGGPPSHRASCAPAWRHYPVVRYTKLAPGRLAAERVR